MSRPTQQDGEQGRTGGATLPTASSSRLLPPHRPPMASPLRASQRHQNASSSGSEEATPTQSPIDSHVDLNYASERRRGSDVYDLASASQSRLASSATGMASRAHSYLGAWKDGAAAWTANAAGGGGGGGGATGATPSLPLHHTNVRNHTGSSTNGDSAYFSVLPSDPTTMMADASAISSRFVIPSTPSRGNLAPSDVETRGDSTAIEARKPSFGSVSGSGGLVAQGNSGGGGYASSVDADYYSAPPSRLVSRTPTPVSHVIAAGRLSSPDLGPSTESDEDESDFYGTTPSGWGATLFGFGNSRSTHAPGYGAKGTYKHNYHTLGTRQGAKWKEADADYDIHEVGRLKGRSYHAKGYDRSSALDGLANSAAPDVRRRSKRRKNRTSKLPFPIRILASLLSKTFRTFFGPIHPLTIMIALALIAGFVTSVTMLIIYILNPDKEPLPWRAYCQQQMPFPHAYADALAPVNVMVGVLTIDSKYERRNVIRNTYARHTLPSDASGRSLANVQVKFILGKVRKAHAARIALEMETYNDIVVLDIDETQSARKTHAYLQWAAENATVPFLHPVGAQRSYHGNMMDTYVPSADAAGGLTNFQYHEKQSPEDSKLASEANGEAMRYEVAWKKVDYVIKADDDTFIVLDELERHLRVAPRRMTYWGYLIKNWFMGGEAYALSFDLVQWIAGASETAKTAKGKEDTRTPQWLAMHPNRSSINWVSEHCWIYDHPKAGSPYSHGFLFPDYVEKIKLEARRGLSEQEIAYRGGERRSQSYSTVSKWHQKYYAPRRDLTVEEEVEALVEGGGRWEGAWVRGADGSTGETWVPYHDIVYQSDDIRLRPSSTNERGSAVLASDVGLEPYSRLPIYGSVVESGDGLSNASLVSDPMASSTLSPIAALESHLASTAILTGQAGEKQAGQKRRGLLNDLSSLPREMLGYRSPSDQDEHNDRADRVREAAEAVYRNAARMLPRPTPKDGYGEWASLRARRYLNRRHGGTVIVHYLKKTEWWYETSLLLLGKPKLWTNGAGGLGTEWRMGGSPLVRSDGFISEGRSAPRKAFGSPAPADDGELGSGLDGSVTQIGKVVPSGKHAEDASSSAQSTYDRLSGPVDSSPDILSSSAVDAQAQSQSAKGKVLSPDNSTPFGRSYD